MKPALSLIPQSFAPRLARTMIAIALLTNLAGCFGLAVGTAVVTTMAATDRRTIGALTEDKAIIVKGEGKIANSYPDAHVNVTSFNRTVLLTGEVKDDATRTAIERDIAAMENVVAVINELEVGFVSNFTSRSNDVLISTKVRASLVDIKDYSSNAVSIVTERGIVYLLGRVTQYEGRVAAEVTSGVSGVRKVVKLFETISEEERARFTKSRGAE